MQTDMIKALNNTALRVTPFGKGVDFHVQGMSAEEVRKWIAQYEICLPCKIRVESDVTSVHIDVMTYGMSANKITYFRG